MADHNHHDDHDDNDNHHDDNDHHVDHVNDRYDYDDHSLGPIMANDYSLDSRCVACWRFENGALTTDSKGTNTLSLVNSPTANTTLYREGAASAEIVRRSSTDGDAFAITDAALASGFPFKSGESNNIITVNCWFYADAVPGSGDYRTIWGKQNWAGSKVSIIFQLQNGYMRFGAGYSTGTSFWFQDFKAVSASRWYFASISFDGRALWSYPVRIAIWDATAASWSWYSYNALGSRIHDARWAIGTEDSNTPYVSYFDGKIDEVVVFNAVLADNERVLMKDGNYNSSYWVQEVDATQVQAAWTQPPGEYVAQTQVQAAWTPPPGLYVDHVDLAAVYYDKDPAMKSEQLLMQVEIEKLGSGMHAQQVVTQVECLIAPTPDPLGFGVTLEGVSYELITKRKHPVLPSNRSRTSQAWKRKHPTIR